MLKFIKILIIFHNEKHQLCYPFPASGVIEQRNLISLNYHFLIYFILINDIRY